MYFPTLVAAFLTISCWQWADAAPEPCKEAPMGKADTLQAPELVKLTADIMPKNFLNGTSGVQGLRPKTISFSPQPEKRPIKDLFFDNLANLGFNNTALFLRKEITNQRSYPWSTIGKLFIYDENTVLLFSCSGTLVGRNLMLTASHCVPWERNGRWQMQFIPAYNGESTSNSRPFGSAWVNRCRGVVNTDDVTGLDYVICQLNSPIGDNAGYMGWHASSGDGFYLDGVWTSVGYPGDSHRGRVPMVEDRIKLDDVDDEGSDGKELESYVYASHGWSGGPMFYLLDGDPRVVGVMSGYEEELSFWDFFVKEHTVSAGGMHMARLIAYGRENWKP